MNVYFVDGFDHGAYSQALQKYTEYSEFNQGSIIAGAQPYNQVGGGRGLWLMNSAFWQMAYTRLVGARSRQVIGFHYQPRFSTGVSRFAESIILRWESQASYTVSRFRDTNDGVQLSVLQKASGKWEFWSGGKGQNGNKGSKLAETTSVPFTPNSWSHVELDVAFGVGGHIRLYVDDVAVMLTNVNVGSATPDRFTLRQEAFGTAGPAFDDLYVSDERLGPCRVTTTWPTGQGTAAEWARTGSGLTANYQAVDERLLTSSTTGLIHDGDTSYLEASNGKRELYTVDPMACYGKILAVAANAVGKDPALANIPGANFVCVQGASTLLKTGHNWPASGAYNTSQGIYQLDPLGADWTDRALQNSAWGMDSAGVGLSRVTLFYLEKLVTLRDVPFSCGKQSYGYGT